MRMMTKIAALALAAVVAGFAADVEAARPTRAEQRKQKREVPLAPDTFAHSVTLDGETGAVLSYTPSENVYKELHLRDFSDLCVFDAEGNAVPFQLRAPGRATEHMTVTKNVPYFLWQPEKPDAGTPGAMDIEINANGGIVRIKGQGDAPPRPGPVSYLLDMKAYLDAVANPAAKDGNVFDAGDVRERALRVSLAGDESFMSSVTMKTSADLAQWRSIGKTQVLARMCQGEITLERDSLALPDNLERYVLLQFSDSEAPVYTFSAHAVFDKTTEETRETIVAGTLQENKRVVMYELPGRFPVVSIGFDLPQTEMMAVRLMGADDLARPYSQFASGFIYRLEKDGAAITGEPFPVKASRRHWSLHAAGEIPFGAAPGMRVYWKPQDLLFLARGKGPWTLAFGRTAPVHATPLPMLDKAGVKPAREIAASAQSGPGGKLAAPPAGETEDSGQWLLWGVLILAVAFLTGITVWLVRSMKK